MRFFFFSLVLSLDSIQLNPSFVKSKSALLLPAVGKDGSRALQAPGELRAPKCSFFASGIRLLSAEEQLADAECPASFISARWC